MNNTELIQKFYTAFRNKDYKTMQTCYADDATFSDSAFVGLNAKEVRAMWHMLISGGSDLKLIFNNVKADEKSGSCYWEATYTFSATKNKVVNKINAAFEFENGKIKKHIDTFDFYTWAKQAFGLTGMLIGWTPFFKNKVQTTARERLKAFIAKNPEYQ